MDTEPSAAELLRLMDNTLVPCGASRKRSLIAYDHVKPKTSTHSTSIS
ncbi:hypothetical protein ACFV1F_35585 [Streptomyces sp. NPDC059590]